jgi:type IV fimbrial biogenesis protein FimT
MHESTGRITSKEFKPRSAMHGVTLFELIVVMGIIAILAAIAVPSYKYVTTSNRISAEINGLLGDLQFARSEAIKEGQSVQVCVSTDGATCATGGNNNWQNGWIVLAPGITLPLRTQSAFTSTDTLVANNSLSAITFNREGFAAGLPATLAVLTLHAATPTTTSTRCLTVQPIGLMAVQGYDGANCT